MYGFLYESVTRKRNILQDSWQKPQENIQSPRPDVALRAQKPTTHRSVFKIAGDKIRYAGRTSGVKLAYNNKKIVRGKGCRGRSFWVIRSLYLSNYPPKYQNNPPLQASAGNRSREGDRPQLSCNEGSSRKRPRQKTRLDFLPTFAAMTTFRAVRAKAACGLCRVAINESEAKSREQKARLL